MCEKYLNELKIIVEEAESKFDEANAPNSLRGSVVEAYKIRGTNEMQTQNVEKNLAKYPHIEKYYGQYIFSLVKKNHPLISLIINEGNYIVLLDSWINKLDSIPDVPHLIKKSKNPADFFNIMSEFKVASFLIAKVDKIKIISSEEPSPDFKIEVLNKIITIEVKRIEDKVESGKGNITYLNSSKTLYEIDDIHTICNNIIESIKKGQYYSNIPHIIIFDCTSGIEEDEFEDVLYPRKDEGMPLYNGSKLIGYGYSIYDGLFYKKDTEENFICSCLSGVAAIFEGVSVSMDPNTSSVDIKKDRIIFFENPNANLVIDKNVLNSLGFRVYETKRALW